jgi:hypothetical protein
LPGSHIEHVAEVKKEEGPKGGASGERGAREIFVEEGLECMGQELHARW